MEYIEAPVAIGKLLIATKEGRVTNVILGKADDDLLAKLKQTDPTNTYEQSEDAKIKEYLDKLIAYLTASTDTAPQDLAAIPIALPDKASEWQIKIWNKMREIPNGKTVTYGELAENAGEEKKAAIAVGGACASNRIAILIPCHRVLAANHQHTLNYRWGAAWKQYLLKLESPTN